MALITAHARERYVTRSNKQFIHIERCGVRHCRDCISVEVNLAYFIRKHKTTIDKEIVEKLAVATEDKSLFNNFQFMTNWHERYGYDCMPSFLVDQKLVYVLKRVPSSNILVTCIDAKTHIAAQRNKYRLNKSRACQV